MNIYLRISWEKNQTFFQAWCRLTKDVRLCSSKFDAQINDFWLEWKIVCKFASSSSKSIRKSPDFLSNFWLFSGIKRYQMILKNQKPFFCEINVQKMSIWRKFSMNLQKLCLKTWFLMPLLSSFFSVFWRQNSVENA